MRKAVQLAGVTMTGLLAGNELSTMVGAHPALRDLPLDAQIQAEQALTGRLGRIMPPYMIAAVLAAAAAAVDRRGQQGSGLALAAAGATVAVLGITVAANVPLNDRTMEYPPDGGAAEWRAIRGRWERLHAVRVLLHLGAFAALAAAALGDE